MSACSINYWYHCDKCNSNFNTPEKVIEHRFGRKPCRPPFEKTGDNQCAFCRVKFWFKWRQNAHFNKCPVRLASMEVYHPLKSQKYNY